MTDKWRCDRCKARVKLVHKYIDTDNRVYYLCKDCYSYKTSQKQVDALTGPPKPADKPAPTGAASAGERGQAGAGGGEGPRALEQRDGATPDVSATPPADPPSVWKNCPPCPECDCTTVTLYSDGYACYDCGHKASPAADPVPLGHGMYAVDDNWQYEQRMDELESALADLQWRDGHVNYTRIYARMTLALERIADALEGVYKP